MQPPHNTGLAFMPAMPLLVLIRPQAQSLRLLDEVEATMQRPVAALIAPVMRIVPVSTGAFVPDDLILTSENGVEHGPDLVGKRVYCVGERTGEAAIRRGGEVQVTTRNADDLVAWLTRTAPAGPLLHIAGRHRRGQIAERLNSAGIETDTAIVYDQIVEPASGATREAVGGEMAVVVPLYSPRSARLLAQMVDRPGPHTHVIALSGAVAAAWRDATSGESEICAPATGAEMQRRIVAALRGVAG